MSRHADDKSQQRPASMAPRGFQSSRPFQPQPQPLSLNMTSAGPKTSMRSASSSISSTSSASSSGAADTIFSPPLLSSSPTATSALLSPLSPSSPTDADPITHIHKNADGSLLMNRNYMSPASPVGEGFLDPRTMRRGAARGPTTTATTGGVVLGRRAPAAPRLHMDLQVSGGAELNMQVRGNVDMIFINTQGPHPRARR